MTAHQPTHSAAQRQSRGAASLRACSPSRSPSSPCLPYLNLPLLYSHPSILSSTSGPPDEPPQAQSLHQPNTPGPAQRPCVWDGTSHIARRNPALLLGSSLVSVSTAFVPSCLGAWDRRVVDTGRLLVACLHPGPIQPRPPHSKIHSTPSLASASPIAFPPPSSDISSGAVETGDAHRHPPRRARLLVGPISSAATLFIHLICLPAWTLAPMDTVCPRCH